MSRRGIMLAYPFEEKRLIKWRPPFVVQPKLDGDRCRALCYHDYVQLLSSEENLITSVPHINDFLHRLGEDLHFTELDGELYTHGMNHQQVHGIASRTVNLHDDFDSLEYHVFDVVENMSMAQRIDQLLRLNEIFKQVPNRPVHIVPFRVAETLDDVMRIYDEFIQQGYEGIIIRDHEANYVRKRSTQVMKFKPKKDDWYTICGYSVQMDQWGNHKKGILGRLICAGAETSPVWFGEVPPEKDPPPGFFAVSSARKGAYGKRDEEQLELWRRREELRFRIAHIQYQHITQTNRLGYKGVPRFPVFCEIIWDLGATNEG